MKKELEEFITFVAIYVLLAAIAGTLFYLVAQTPLMVLR